MKLICFPYAGASSSVFLKWRKYLDGIKIIPVDPPGRGKRLREPLCSKIEEMLDDIKKQILSLIDNEEEYSFYGHSMGCLLIFDLLHEMQKMNLPMPVHVFLSGKNPPNVAVKTSIHQLDDAKFMEKLLEMGGMDTRFFENPTLSKIFLPVLRKDLGIVEKYQYKDKKQKLPIDVTMFFSPQDSWTDSKHINKWADFISGSFDLYHFNGDHFFIFNYEEKITGIIRETLSNKNNIIPY